MELVIKMAIGVAITYAGASIGGEQASATTQKVSGAIITIFSGYGAGTFIFWIGGLL